MSAQPPDPRLGKDGTPRANGPGEQNWIRVVVGIIVVVAIVVFVGGHFLKTNNAKPITYSTWYSDLEKGSVQTVAIDNSTGTITGKLNNGSSYTAPGPVPPSLDDQAAIKAKHLNLTFGNSTGGLLAALIPYIFLFLVFGLLILWMRRSAQGQMSAITSIGRSRAKLYSTERPKTTFDDVAGYNGVKQEISEVVDFLKNPDRFAEIGAKIPKGILLVGPPGTGKTLLARAVAGEAGVPFMSVSGSDFMEMFVGVGASRVRDMFQTARKQAPAIVFVDEIDSIGRKRGAGLGGGHDEREQTLNQMLSEMDGFEATEGIVMIAATNRPDILDPALLRPGRFDRQVVVPLPDLDERQPILEVHSKGKKIGSDVDLSVVARGTPGMSGADLANLVNEAALHAVRRGSKEIEMADFEEARDRVLMGARRDSLALNGEEKERVAYHEGGHAVLAYVLEHADPVHKVTILPTGMALGVTQQLPMEERHIYGLDYIADSLAVRMGGRVAEMVIYGNLSTGANNDLVGATELARKMVREWGMSDRFGPMAWGSQGVVFLGEDLMHSRDYSEDTSRVIDEEVERILREQEERATQTLRTHRPGLEALAHALLEKETVDGAEVGRIVDEACGHSHDFPIKSASSNGSANGNSNGAVPKSAVPQSDALQSAVPQSDGDFALEGHGDTGGEPGNSGGI